MMARLESVLFGKSQAHRTSGINLASFPVSSLYRRRYNTLLSALASGLVAWLLLSPLTFAYPLLMDWASVQLELHIQFLRSGLSQARG